MSRTTIRLRLTLYWGAVLAAILVIAGLAVFFLFERKQWDRLDSALLEEADTSTETIQRTGMGAAAPLIHTLSMERDLGPSRRILLVSSKGVLVDTGDLKADLPALRTLPQADSIVDGGRRVFRYAIVPFELSGRRLWLEDGVDATPVRTSIDHLRNSLLLIIPLLLIACVSGSYWLAGRALVPINMLIAGLSEIDPREPSKRLAVGEAADEVAHLTRAINALLDRVERASSAERRFATDAAHELRTPLTVLRTELEVTLGRERRREEYQAALGSAWREVLTLCRMADELLALSRLEEEVAVSREPVNLKTLINEVVDAVGPLAEAKRLDLVTNLDGDIVVNGSPGHLRRLAINLLDNALKFTPENGTVAIKLESDGTRALMSVDDTGPGIAAADLPLIFERFFRGTSGNQPGSGLGLSLCREIARLHGGEIEAHNREGGGSEFVVTIPLPKSTTTVESSERSESAAQKT